LITGGAGFVGAPAVAELQRRGFETHVVVRPGTSAAGQHRHEVDGLDVAAMRALIDEVRPSHFLHLAWCTEHGAFWEDPANAEWSSATEAIAEAFASAGGARLVFAGSCTQYDWSDAALGTDGVAHERTTPMHAATTYGRAKADTMRALDELGEHRGISVATGLVFFPYGPREKQGRLVPSVTCALLAGEPARTTPGRQVRDFVFVDDCGASIAALLDSDVTGSVNLGSGTGTAVGDVARTIARLLDREELLELGALPEREGEPARLVADLARLRDEVGYEPSTTIEDGLRAAIEYWSDQRTRRR
jgi:nucleoside-diphosphate-sugar epimerase